MLGRGKDVSERAGTRGEREKSEGEKSEGEENQSQEKIGSVQNPPLTTHQSKKRA